MVNTESHRVDKVQMDFHNQILILNRYLNYFTNVHILCYVSMKYHQLHILFSI